MKLKKLFAATVASLATTCVIAEPYLVGEFKEATPPDNAAAAALSSVPVVLSGIEEIVYLGDIELYPSSTQSIKGYDLSADINGTDSVTTTTTDDSGLQTTVTLAQHKYSTGYSQVTAVTVNADGSHSYTEDVDADYTVSADNMPIRPLAAVTLGDVLASLGHDSVDATPDGATDDDGLYTIGNAGRDATGLFGRVAVLEGAATLTAADVGSYSTAEVDARLDALTAADVGAYTIAEIDAVINTLDIDGVVAYAEGAASAAQGAASAAQGAVAAATQNSGTLALHEGLVMANKAEIAKVKKESLEGTAMGMAMANMPTASMEGLSISMGTGFYESKSAFAGGLTYGQKEFTVKASLATAGSKMGYGFGASMKLY